MPSKGVKPLSEKCVIWPLKITLIGRKTKPFIRGFDTPMRHIDPCESKKNSHALFLS
jgi:hypothetical protein